MLCRYAAWSWQMISRTARVIGWAVAYLFMALAFIGLVMPACTVLALCTLIQDIFGGLGSVADRHL